MKSHALLRTNVGLTTNAKLVVGSSYSLYIDAIISTSELSSSNYSKFGFSKSNYWDELVPYFFKGTPTNISYAIKSDNDWDKMSNDFSKQYDELYNYGARNIIENKDYTEEYEYFAPLHISKTGLPTNFIIFRVDGSGLGRIGFDNFKTEILNKLKCVKNFDLTTKTPIGEWLDTNITRNKFFPETPLYIDFRRLEFSYWSGIDYEDGGYSQKSIMLESILDKEQTFFDFQKFFFDGWQNNKVIYPHIINFSFLFDDQPSTPSSIRKWSLNRYVGFYLDKFEFSKSVSPYQTPALKDDVIISSGNILSSPSSVSPFAETWEKNDFPWVEIEGKFYPIISYRQAQNVPSGVVRTGRNTLVEANTTAYVKKWKIISDIDLSAKQAEVNKNIIKIVTVADGNQLLKSDGTAFSIDGWDDGDVWLIEIDGSYHNLIKKDDGIIYINTDYAFEQSINKFDYYVNDPIGRKSISLLVDQNNPPKTFGIYKCYFSEVMDFDTDLVETGFSKFEYMMKEKITLTDEPKMYFQDLNSNSNPKDYDDFEVAGQVVNIPVSSEYIANSELFRLINGDLNQLWRKNPQFVKWGFQNSISSNDYPYLLNNSFISEDFNRTANPFDIIPNRVERNLDHFLTINSDSNSYEFHSLHIQDDSFDLSKYLEVGWSGDYFDYLFSKKSEFDSGNITLNTKKYSQFNLGGEFIPNETLFRGIKYKLWNVSSVQIQEGAIKSINLKGGSSFDDWKFGVLLSENNQVVFETLPGTNLGGLTSSTNTLKWTIVDSWKHDKTYDIRSIVNWNEILYISTTQSNITDPNKNPSNSPSWILYGPPNLNHRRTIFWHPSFSGNSLSDTIVTFTNFGLTGPPLVYNYGEYYYSKMNSDPNFWNPTATYNNNDVVFFKNKTWLSTNTSIGIEPGSSKTWKTAAGSPSLFWYETSSPKLWNVVPFWEPDRDWSTPLWSFGNFNGSYVIWNDTVWGIDLNATPNPPIGISPDQNSDWKRIWSMSPDTTYPYNYLTKNNIILEQNNRLYMCVGNSLGSTLENGITIYVNRKRKNVLLNICINDNTFTKFIPNQFLDVWDKGRSTISDTNRDSIYNDLYSKLTANNIINAINDLENLYQFSDHVKYVEIGLDSSLKVWDFNNLQSVFSLPFLLKCDVPDEFLVKNSSLKVTPVTLEPSEIKAKRVLDGGKITSLDQLNWYNNLSLSSTIEKSDDLVKIQNFSGLKNQLYSKMWRFSGNYSPIFKPLELLKAPLGTMSWNGSKFDTTLTDFGVLKGRLVSKINPNGSILKLKNKPNLKSIYPMLNEFGYHLHDSFVFKSTWDFDYHIQTSELPPPLPLNANISIQTNQSQTNTEELL